MTTADEWCVIVWDGHQWFRGPVWYETREAAEACARRIKVAPCRVLPCRELEAGWPPAPDGDPWRSSERK